MQRQLLRCVRKKRRLKTAAASFVSGPRCVEIVAGWRTDRPDNDEQKIAPVSRSRSLRQPRFQMLPALAARINGGNSAKCPQEAAQPG
jgi:hypothetical protein